MKGHGRRESAAHRRGASKQSRVQHNSCASVATTVKTSKASLRARHGESTYKESDRRSTERENPHPLARWPAMASTEPAMAAA